MDKTSFLSNGGTWANTSLTATVCYVLCIDWFTTGSECPPLRTILGFSTSNIADNTTFSRICQHLCYFGVIGRRSRLKICFRYGVWVRVPEVVSESIILSFDLFGYAFCLWEGLYSPSLPSYFGSIVKRFITPACHAGVRSSTLRGAVFCKVNSLGVELTC